MSRKLKTDQPAPSSTGDLPQHAQLVSILAGAVSQQIARPVTSPAIEPPGNVVFVKDIANADDRIMSSIENTSLSPAELCIWSGYSRAKVNRILTRLIATGRVSAVGSTRDRKYSARRTQS